mmetsp:Transcript_2798/g.4229  ORF Transcript_2798/g.4229 Transcript_2798/m.4229 type:complete len:169 (+) Transcript_2798:88-594(+)|eukprot:CAMPEP_0197235646 /NCGR_PEP_ID=MMETSP1429-20130617/3020_1 /TAXON_ID=49237 /ORGANISM="Chaetoceros  sp., Strain UNC1202" /LENGTH=168 /DNA_ID=CAMNT_0042694285 /DNA_START=88 /DNA_END=594 /DNA_ORIENTATION=+
MTPSQIIITLILQTILVVVLLSLPVDGFTPLANVGSRTKSGIMPQTSCAMGIEVMDLEGLQSHEEEGTRLSKSIQGWLDVEWMPQEVHLQMGDRAKITYIQARESGDDEIMSIMTKVTDDLYADWKLYDKDAFVNAWDIGNYVSDYLLSRLGAESCGCNAEIFNPDGN